MATGVELSGRLQRALMRAVWKSGGGTVRELLDQLPASERPRYTTVQTVLNRLAERGLLSRRRIGRALRYEPAIDEANFLAGAVKAVLEGASPATRERVLRALLNDRS